MRAALLLLLLLAAPARAQELSLPSGLAARLFDVRLEPIDGPMAPDAFTDPEGEAGEATMTEDDPAISPGADPLGEALPPPPDAREGGRARFRLAVEGLGGAESGYDRVAGDFGWLCETLALPALAANGWTPAEVVIALSDRETAFGVPDPEATQFFEGFRIADGACVPQAF